MLVVMVVVLLLVHARTHVIVATSHHHEWPRTVPHIAIPAPPAAVHLLLLLLLLLPLSAVGRRVRHIGPAAVLAILLYRIHFVMRGVLEMRLPVLKVRLHVPLPAKHHSSLAHAHSVATLLHHPTYAVSRTHNTNGHCLVLRVLRLFVTAATVLSLARMLVVFQFRAFASLAPLLLLLLLLLLRISPIGPLLARGQQLMPKVTFIPSLTTPRRSVPELAKRCHLLPKLDLGAFGFLLGQFGSIGWARG